MEIEIGCKNLDDYIILSNLKLSDHLNKVFKKGIIFFYLSGSSCYFLKTEFVFFLKDDFLPYFPPFIVWII